jgi:predicted nucleic acid-binding protein
MTFFIGRPGAEKVKELIYAAIEGKKELLMSVVNWGEVYYSVWHERGREAAQKTLAEIAQLPIEIVDADAQLTKLAAELKAQHKLPYADSFAAALAQQRKATLVTSDKNFQSLQGRSNLLWVDAE